MDAACAKKLAIAAVVGMLIVIGGVVTGADAKKRLRLTCDQTTDAIFKTAQGFRAKYNSMGFTIEDAPYGILVTTVLTTISGLPLPPFGVTPARVVGAISLVLLAVAIAALYGFRLAGAWRWIYVGSALAALYLNVFVGVTQSFQKLSFLKPLAPTQSEPAFQIGRASCRERVL